MRKHPEWIITRREFLKVSSSVIAGLSIDPRFALGWWENTKTRIKFGIVTDSHFANTEHN